ncbi:MAG: ribosome biogenesis GTPase Der [Fimbriiglobus sp.]
MALPIVAIVGRPNVGKSSLFNWLAGRRISIVDPTAGVTRDRVATTLTYSERHFDLVDTGGMGIVDVDNLTEDVERQIAIALLEAAVILFVVDVRDGVVPLDEMVAARLRGIEKPVIFVINKVDDPKFDLSSNDFYRLGYGDSILVSAHQKRGKEELFDAILKHLPADADNTPPSSIELKIAIVGRRNVGKSTFINSLAQEDRVIVSEVAGTTRDSIDVRFERDTKTFLAIDTAGVRKKKSLESNIEYYSLHRAERSIRRADVVLHFFDPRLRISRVDKQLTEYILENNKPAIFVVNKWDLAKDKIVTERWVKYLRDVFSMLDYVPVAFITAKDGKNVFRLLNLAQQLHKQSGRRVKTGELNRVVQEAVAANAPPMRLNRQGKIYYATQTDVHPPTIVIMTNGPELFDPPYVRYITKVIRDSFPFREIALKIILRDRSDPSTKRESPADTIDLNTLPEPTGEDTMPLPSLMDEAIPEDGDNLLEQMMIDEPPPLNRPEKPVSKPKPKPKKPKKKPKGETWDF